MAIPLYLGDEAERLRAAGRLAADVLRQLSRQVQPGVTTGQVDRWARELIRAADARPSPLGCPGPPGVVPFPAAICTSVDHVVCHGIPSDACRLESGQLVNVDVTVELNGFHGDTSRTLLLPGADEDAQRLVAVAERCLWEGIDAVRPGARLGDIGAVIERLALAEGCSVVRELGGHGIGRQMHQPPHVSHFGRPGTGLRLRPGMAFTIEPMLNWGRPEVETLADGWTVVTCDGKRSAQFEHSVLVTESGVEVLTLP